MSYTGPLRHLDPYPKNGGIMSLDTSQLPTDYNDPESPFYLPENLREHYVRRVGYLSAWQRSELIGQNEKRAGLALANHEAKLRRDYRPDYRHLAETGRISLPKFMSADELLTARTDALTAKFERLRSEWEADTGARSADRARVTAAQVALDAKRTRVENAVRGALGLPATAPVPSSSTGRISRDEVRARAQAAAAAAAAGPTAHDPALENLSAKMVQAGIEIEQNALYDAQRAAEFPEKLSTIRLTADEERDLRDRLDVPPAQRIPAEPIPGALAFGTTENFPAQIRSELEKIHTEALSAIGAGPEGVSGRLGGVLPGTISDTAAWEQFKRDHWDAVEALALDMYAREQATADAQRQAEQAEEAAFKVRAVRRDATEMGACPTCHLWVGIPAGTLTPHGHVPAGFVPNDEELRGRDLTGVDTKRGPLEWRGTEYECAACEAEEKRLSGIVRPLVDRALAWGKRS